MDTELGFDEGYLREVFQAAEQELMRRQDWQDYQNELAGVDVGREVRFHTTEFVEDRRQGRSGTTNHSASRQQYASRLQLMLATNAAYARAYNNAFDAVRGAADAADNALTQMEAALGQARQEIESMLDGAARLPDGRRVFKDAQGQVWDQDGARVSDEDAAAIHWRGDEPTREAFTDTSQYAERLSRGIDEVRGIQVDLGGIKEELSDYDTPPTQERSVDLYDTAKAHQKRIDEISNENDLRGMSSETIDLTTRAIASDIPIPKL